MAEAKFYIPHPFQSRGWGVVVNPETPSMAQLYFDVDGSARYLFSMPRRELKRLARAIDRTFERFPKATQRQKGRGRS